MSEKTYIPRNGQEPTSQIGATFESLTQTIKSRRATEKKSYTHDLLHGNVDDVLKKIIEEAGEVLLAAKDAEAARTFGTEVSAETDATVDHLRYEAADLVYHLLVLLERNEIPLEEFAAELNMRMTEEERPAGAVCLFEEYIKRGK